MTAERNSRIHGIILLLMTVCLLNIPAQAQYGGGTGEPNDPYQIATAEDLILLGESPDDYYKHFILTADIDLDPNLPGGKVFNEAIIGYFRGVFDGNNHSILNMTINGGGYLGLFKQLESEAKVRDLAVVDVNIAGIGSRIGGLVGINRSHLVNCFASGTINGTVEEIGGLVGLNYSIVEICHSTGTVIGNRFIGGLVGENLGYVMACYSTSDVSGDSGIGGLVGTNSTTPPILGGGPSMISDCYATGHVNASDGIAGGLVGSNNAGSVIRCYSTGLVIGNEDIGGLVGLNKDNVIQCFWDTQTSQQIVSAGGKGKTSAEMKRANTFLIWGTCGNEVNWTIDEGRDYPRLYWEDKPGELITVGLTLSDFLMGEGTENNPFLIYTADELNIVGSFPCDWDKNFKLMSDIDLSDFDGREDRSYFNIIGSDKKSRAGVPFTGIFDGNGYTIANFTYTLEKNAGNIGLFGLVADVNAQIKNVGLIDPNVDGGSQWNIGCLAGFLKDGSIINCYVEGGSVKGGQNVGGLIGYNDKGSITLCHSTNLENKADGQAGGLVGWNYGGNITMSYSSGSITAKFGRVGGLVGMNDYSSIDTCYSTCTVSIISSAGSDAGGLVGHNAKGRINTSYSTGIVIGNHHVGGLAGSNSGSIIVSYSTCPVTGNWMVGGFVGDNSGNLVSNYSTGTVKGNDAVGGLVGSNGGSISMSYSSGTVSGISNVGGLVGSGDPGFATSSVWDKEASGQIISAGGVGLTTIEMQDIDTYLTTGWDFVDEVNNGTCDYWQISQGDYPQLCSHVGINQDMPQGLGTAQEPYLIRNAQDLGTVWFKPFAHYKLEISIDMSGIMWSTAAIPWFGGTFDGNGHVISNLQIKGSGHLGLFGQLEFGAMISNVGIENIDIHGTGNNVGGLAGYNNGNITMSYSAGIVTGNNDVGGLIGRNIRNLTSSYSNANVTGNKRVGGLLGVCISNGSIKNNYSAGVVIGNEDIGGLIGYNYWSDITSCYWDIETSGLTTSIDGIGLTTADMQTASTFIEAGWDFVDETANGTEDIWWIDEGRGYPRLWWEAHN